MESSAHWPQQRPRDDRDGPLIRAIGRARGYLARHRPLVGLLLDACTAAGVEPPDLALPPLRTVADKPRPITLRVAEHLRLDPAAIATVMKGLEVYRVAHAAVLEAERLIAEGQEPPSLDDLLPCILPLETYPEIFGVNAGLSEILPNTRTAPIATTPLVAPSSGSYTPSRELDKLLRVEEGLARMRAALDKLWVQVKVLQGAIDFLQNPAAADHGVGRSSATARELARVLAESAAEAEAVKAFLQEFYGFQVMLQNEKARLTRLKRTSRPQAPDLRDIRAHFHKLGLSFHQINGRPGIRQVFFEVGSAPADDVLLPTPAPGDLPFRVQDYVARAQATLAQLRPRRDILALAYHSYLGLDTPLDPESPTPSQIRSAQAVADCLADNAAEAKAVAGALERFEAARAILEDFEARMKIADQAPPDQRLAILAALDLVTFREKLDPLAHFGREFKGHFVLGRLFPSPTEVFGQGFKRQGTPPAGPRPSQDAAKTGGLFEGLIHKIRSATSPLIPPKPPG